MTTQTNTQGALPSLISLETAEAPPARTTGACWTSEARLHVLACEIAYYMPGLAQELVRAGKRKLAA